MTSVTYFPVVENESQLVDLLSRASWFLTYLPLEDIYVPISEDSLARIAWRVSDGMDESIAKYFEILRSRLQFVRVESEADLRPIMLKAHVFLFWKKDCRPSFVSSAVLADWVKGKKVWQVDPDAVRMEGSFYIEAGLDLLPNKSFLIEESRARFWRLVEDLGRFDRAYLMATGPSISHYKKFDYQNALKIVCNSVILDEELMEAVQPQILVFADPIFHFGPSQYAGAFRKSLIESARRHKFNICIPFKYYGLFVAIMPELADRAIGIPFEKDREWNFALDEEFSLKTTANILTFLMIPLAGTFAKEIGFLGCDGRPLEENTYFWGHGKKTQINDKMANIQEVHPGFFAIDYNDYYLEHCNTLEAELAAGEKCGLKFYSLAFSHIPALKSRIDRAWRESDEEGQEMLRQVVIVDPDAKSWAGHYMAYNEKLSAELKLRSIPAKVICRRDLEAAILASRPSYIPVLTVHSWQVGNRTDNATFVERFVSELEEGLADIIDEGAGPTTLYMYCGSLDHAKALAELAAKYEALQVNINLFWLSFTLNRGVAEQWKDFIVWLDKEAGQRKFLATVPTKELRNELAEYTGCILPVAPHPSTGLSDRNFREVCARRLDVVGKRVFRVLFPSAPRPEKGYVASVACAKLLGNASGMRPIIRHAPTFSTPKDLANPLVGMPKTVEVVEGELTDDQFLDLFKRADIAVLPYTPDAFAKRTSGLLIDSIYHGIPCVVVRGTWLANIVESYGCGEIADECTADQLADAVTRISQNYEQYSANAWAAGRDYFSENSWRVFSDFLCGVSRGRAMGHDEMGIGQAVLFGSYTREQAAHLDETNAIALLFDSELTGSTMVDVGAHHGSALMPFLNKEWKIYAFEPDERNRSKLCERLYKHKNKALVSLDTRCVSNGTRKSVSFYRSAQSTGISGLSAFHESHVEAQRVDTTTLTEFFNGKPMPMIDFLKIDTEGHDLFVLQGYPWDLDKPAVVECEFEDAKTVSLGYNFHDLARFLVGKGYAVYVSEWHPIIRYGIRHDWYGLKRYPCELASQEAWGNLLAFRDDPGEQVVAAAVKACVNVKNPEAIHRGTKHERDNITVLNAAKNPLPPKSRPAPPPSAPAMTMGQWVRLRYMNIGAAVKARSLALFRLGQVLAWSARGARRHPVASAGFLLGLFALVALPAFSAFWPYRIYLWAMAGLVGLAGGAVALMSAAQQVLLRLMDVVRSEMGSNTRVVRQALERRIANLEKQIEALGPEVQRQLGKESIDSIEGRLSAMDGAISSLRGNVEHQAAMYEKAKAELQEEIRNDLRMASLEARLSSMSGNVADRLRNELNAALRSHLDAISGEIRAFEQKCDDEVGAIRGQVSEIAGKLNVMTSSVEQNAGFQRFNRTLTPEHIDKLQTVWNKRLGINTTKPALAYMAHRIRIAEQNAIGRLASSIEDAVLRTLVCSAVRAKTLEVIEIGTLFGIGLAILYENNHARYDSVHVTAVDPLDGYYGEKVPDKLLDIPVTKATFWRNMDVLGIPREDITLVEELSTSGRAIASAKLRRYDVLVVDGDHSYEGVKTDFDSYVGMMRKGGFIIFDDYSASDWPDVKRFVDEEVRGREDLAFVGAEWRTAVFQVVMAPESEQS